jgi:hypothetical protein
VRDEIPPRPFTPIESGKNRQEGSIRFSFHPFSLIERACWPTTGDTATTTQKKFNRPDEMARDQKLIDGLTKHAGIIATLYVNGQPFTAAQAVTTLQGRVNAGTAVAPAKAAYRQAVKADHDERAQTKAFVSSLRQALLLMFAGQPQVLADLGIEPRKAPAKRTAAEKKAAVERGLGTRELRHTKGPKEKARIQAPPVPAEPATSQVTPEPAASPAPAVQPQNKAQS